MRGKNQFLEALTDAVESRVAEHGELLRLAAGVCDAAVTALMEDQYPTALMVAARLVPQPGWIDAECIDYVPPNDAREAPYCDQGGMGMALVEVSRYTQNRWQARHGYSGSTAHEVYVVGKNENGAVYSHRVVFGMRTVESAVQWIWGGRAREIVRRQGDVAVICAPGPRMPAQLPDGHCVVRDAITGEVWIMHHTHPPMLAPWKGERLIVGRRAARKILTQTRD